MTDYKAACGGEFNKIGQFNSLDVRNAFDIEQYQPEAHGVELNISNCYAKNSVAGNFKSNTYNFQKKCHA